MKLVKITNTSKKRLAFPVRGPSGTRLVLDPQESKNVSPATVKHPAVSRYIGQGLEVEGDSAAAPKQKEPEAPKPPAQPSTPPAAPNPDTKPGKDETGDDSKEPADESAGENAGKPDFKATLVSDAPGVDEKNVDAVLEAFPTRDALAKAKKPVLADLGIEKPNLLIRWAKEQN